MSTVLPHIQYITQEAFSILDSRGFQGFATSEIVFRWTEGFFCNATPVPPAMTQVEPPLHSRLIYSSCTYLSWTRSSRWMPPKNKVPLHLSRTHHKIRRYVCLPSPFLRPLTPRDVLSFQNYSLTPQSLVALCRPIYNSFRPCKILLPAFLCLHNSPSVSLHKNTPPQKIGTTKTTVFDFLCRLAWLVLECWWEQAEETEWRRYVVGRGGGEWVV